MQTFLPYRTFAASAKVLDRQRLGKQRVENLQIMQALLGIKLDNVQKTVKGPPKMFHYILDDDGYEFEVEAHEVSDYDRPGYTHRQGVEHTYNRVDTDPSEWTVIPLEKPGWVNHPVTKMWVGYEWALLKYQKAICEEWTKRGYKDTCFKKTFALYFSDLERPSDEAMPNWLGNRRFHLAHKSNLVRKDPEHYGPIFKGIPPDLPYIYPVSDRLERVR